MNDKKKTPQTSSFENPAFASLFEKIRRPIASRVGDEIVRLASIENGDSLLDLGCGPGLITKSILKRRSLSRALLVDSSPEMIKLAKENLQREKEFTSLKVKRGSLDNPNRAIGGGKFDHVIGIDLWHLLPTRRKLIHFLSRNALGNKGNLTIALHRETSQKKLEEWHEIRSAIRSRIQTELAKEFPKFAFQTRSKGPTVHSDEISLYLSELEKAGFGLAARHEESELADINQMIHHLPESFMIEVRRIMPSVRISTLSRIIRSAVKNVLDEKGKRDFDEDFKIATEVFFVFSKSKQEEI